MGVYKLNIGNNFKQKNEALKELKKKISFSCFDSFEIIKSKNDYFLKFESKDLNLLKKVKSIIENLGNESKLDKISKLKKCAKPTVKQLAAREKFTRMVKNKSINQPGVSNKKIDAKKRAKLPGKRVSVNNRVYYESRANRSDINPAKMLGIGSISLNEIGMELLGLEQRILSLKLSKKNAKLIKDKKEIQSKITALSNQFKSLKSYLNTRARFK